uniref:Uncharacterized protein n=1 Tax=Salix viminalis TaxID=40686 RepID=A0A6N2M1I1_SALVM
MTPYFRFLFKIYEEFDLIYKYNVPDRVFMRDQDIEIADIEFVFGGGSAMAGMLPGVECARRRRFHQSGDSLGASGTRLKQKQRSVLNQAFEDEKLVGVAREAKERLDGRLRMQKKEES